MKRIMLIVILALAIVPVALATNPHVNTSTQASGTPSFAVAPLSGGRVGVSGCNFGPGGVAIITEPVGSGLSQLDKTSTTGGGCFNIVIVVANGPGDYTVTASSRTATLSTTVTVGT